MIVCKVCRVPFEEGAQFCGTCGGFVDYVGVSEGSGASPATGATGASGAGGADTSPRPDTAQMQIAASAADEAERRAIAEAEAKDRENVEALGRAAAAAAAEAAARAAAVGETDTEAKAAAEAEARAQAAAKAKAQEEADAAARAAEASRRAAAMIAKPSPRPTPAPAGPTAAPPPPTPAPPSPPPIEPGEVACGQCGAGNPATRTFCRKCGAELKPVAPVPTAAVKAPGGGFLRRYQRPLVGVFLLLLVAVAFALTRGDGNDDLSQEAATTSPPTSAAPPREEEVTVDAKKPYVESGISLAVGDRVEIVARGEAESGGGTTGPEGDSNPNFRSASVLDGGHNGLIAKIGVRGKPFFVGARLTFDAEEEGELFLGVNDTGVDNNDGAYVADVTVS